MIAVGCDVGSLTTKAVVMDGRCVLGHALATSRTRPWEVAEMVTKQALAMAGLEMGAVRRCVATGDARTSVKSVRRELLTRLAWTYPRISSSSDGCPRTRPSVRPTCAAFPCSSWERPRSSWR